MSRRIDYSGYVNQRFGRLVIERVEFAKPRSIAHVRCDCGTKKTIRIDHLLRQDIPVRGCGCIRNEIGTFRFMTHGRSGTDVHRIWRNMINRCENPRVPSYQRYGARGIRVCDRWRKNFADFFVDVGPRPSPQHSIDRIDTNGHYEPGNVRWATTIEQAQNRRTNKTLTLNGETLCIAEWARRTGISGSCLIARNAAGWTDERALTTPSKGRKRRPPVEAADCVRRALDNRQRELFADGR